MFEVVYTMASISDVRVAVVMLQALADIGASGGVVTSAVAADARVTWRLLLSFRRARTKVPDGELQHDRYAPGV